MESKFYGANTQAAPLTTPSVDISLPYSMHSGLNPPPLSPTNMPHLPRSPSNAATDNVPEVKYEKFIIITDRALSQDEVDTFSTMGALVNFTAGNFQPGTCAQLAFDYMVIRLTAASRPWIQMNSGSSLYHWIALTTDSEQRWVKELPFEAVLKKLPDGFDNPAFKAQFNELMKHNHLPLPKGLLAKNKDLACTACLGALGLASRAPYP